VTADRASSGEQIAEVIAELAIRPPGDWPAALRARFPGDPGLVAQLLVWLHTQRELAGDAERTAELGDHTRYELATRLGAGATATVWQAYDRKLRRNVAIKVFDAGAALALDEILAEARAAAEVTSDHVVRVLDVHDGDSPYLVMELVAEHDPRTGGLQVGASAASSRPRDLSEAVRWVRDIARGVHDAHLRNVFHRDLKPHNALIAPISRRAKIADFGLAQTSAGHPAGAARSGMVVEIGAGRIATRIAGTPSYMAPEQARGLALSLDPRDPADRQILVGIDIWGLGAIAYDLLSGRPPWQSGHALEAWEIAQSAPPPAALERTAHGERIPRRLRRIVQRALAKVPGDRYPSAEALADELDAALGSRPTSFDRSPAMRLALWSKRNPQLTATAAVAVVLGAMSLAGYATVQTLRNQRAALAAEVRGAELDRARLAEQARASRRELSATDASLGALQRALAEANDEYRAIVQAKQDALRDANLATRALATARGERDIAERTRELYETFWTRARSAAEQASRERDEAARDRDAARLASDQALKERDEARAGRARAERDRDLVRSELERNAAARRQADAEIARLIGELSVAMSRIGQSSQVGQTSPATAAVGVDRAHPAAAGPGPGNDGANHGDDRAEPIAPGDKGAVH
jgi:serine/threonine protein kinase